MNCAAWAAASEQGENRQHIDLSIHSDGKVPIGVLTLIGTVERRQTL